MKQSAARLAPVLTTPPARRTERNTLDLRGMSLSEAQDDCDMFFSTSIMDGTDGVYLLHGHGTGVLKAGIRRVRTNNRQRFFIAAGGGALSVFWDGAPVATRGRLSSPCGMPHICIRSWFWTTST